MFKARPSSNFNCSAFLLAVFFIHSGTVFIMYKIVILRSSIIVIKSIDLTLWIGHHRQPLPVTLLLQWQFTEPAALILVGHHSSDAAPHKRFQRFRKWKQQHLQVNSRNGQSCFWAYCRCPTDEGRRWIVAVLNGKVVVATCGVLSPSENG